MAQVEEQTTAVTETLDALRQATVAGDLGTVTGMYTPDAVVASPFGTFSDPDAIRGFYGGFVQQHPNLSVTYIDRRVAHGVTEVHRSLVASDSIRGAGLERLVFIETIVVAQGKVRSATILLDMGDPQTAQFAAALS